MLFLGLLRLQALFNVLQKKVQNFHLLVVYVIEGPTFVCWVRDIGMFVSSNLPP